LSIEEARGVTATSFIRRLPEPTRDRGVHEMKDSARYVKIVEWSEEDHCYVGSSPGLIYGGCHGADEKAVFDELCRSSKTRSTSTAAKAARCRPPRPAATSRTSCRTWRDLRPTVIQIGVTHRSAPRSVARPFGRRRCSIEARWTRLTTWRARRGFRGATPRLHSRSLTSQAGDGLNRVSLAETGEGRYSPSMRGRSASGCRTSIA
jgi:hypothetical protein